jgi:hypothetical protein
VLHNLSSCDVLTLDRLFVCLFVCFTFYIYRRLHNYSPVVTVILGNPKLHHTKSKYFSILMHPAKITDWINKETQVPIQDHYLDLSYPKISFMCLEKSSDSSCPSSMKSSSSESYSSSESSMQPTQTMKQSINIAEY